MFPFSSTKASPALEAVEDVSVKLPHERSFEQLVEEELKVQAAVISMEGGMPTCTHLFDNLLLCFNLPSQFKSLYRYGMPSDCNRHWEDFKFCMSIKNVSPEKQHELWLRRKAEWWAQRRMGHNSEDIWVARKDAYVSGGESDESASL